MAHSPRFSVRSPVLLLLLALALPAPAQKVTSEAADPDPKGKAGKPNRLATEKSPYLLQHASNPVNWYPWGDEAFETAAKEGKPVFLSIGYSTCHWCHVMAHESFEDEETAAFLNKHFIAIKVDREERPDVDRIYMNYQQAIHGNGGWPLSVWLTPNRIPFFSGTYFPKEARPGTQGTFMDLLGRIRETWEKHSTEITTDSTRILERMTEVFNSPADADAAKALGSGLPAKAFEQLAAAYDPQFGGFGDRPKFPQPSYLNFLLEHLASLGPGNDSAKRSLEMVEATLGKMAQGGIFDQLGGGFHRYSVDEFWHVPHFEKMLYDQAQLASVYLDAFQVTRNPEFEKIARSIFTYVERHLSHPDGAFYSAEDADSLDPAGVHTEKSEGAFYLWDTTEIAKLLGPGKSPIFSAAYDVQENGNSPAGSDPFGEFKGKNILFRKKTAAELSETFKKPAEEIERILSECRDTLFEARSKRPRPHLDDKILTAWNGLMISACAKAHTVLEAPATDSSAKNSTPFLDRAVAAASFIKRHLYLPGSKTLLRSYRDGPSTIQATADDYAFFIQSILDLYEASLDPSWLRFALELQERQFTLLYDEKNGGFYDAPETQTDLILRLKNVYDGALPSANSVSALNLLRLAAILKSDRFEGALKQLFDAFAGDLTGNPVAHSTLLVAFARHLDTPTQIVIAGKPGDPATNAILEGVRSKFVPNKVLLLLDSGPGAEFLASQNEMYAAFKPIDGKSTLYLCRNFTCEKPVSDPKEIAAQLKKL